MRELLKHLKLDPDGGILNIGSSHADINAQLDKNQLSKLHALKKDNMEIFLAFICVVRAISNAGHIIFVSALLLVEYCMDTKFAKDLNDIHRQVKFLPLPLNELAVFVRLGELLVILWMLVRLLWNWCALCCSRDGRRYHLVATLFWRDLPPLQTFSSLRVLCFVHPNLILKYKKKFSVHREAARALLEKFLGLDEDSVIDEDLVSEATEILLEVQYRDKSEEEQLMIAHEYLTYSPYQVLMPLMEAELVMQGVGLDPKCDPAVLRNRWRLQAVVFFEDLAFVLAVCVILVFGIVAFTVKICYVGLVVTAADCHPVTAAYFIMAFLNQVMSIVAVDRLLLWRVETFVFGGSDAEVSPEEEFVVQAYMSHLCQKVWQNESLSWVQQISIMLMLDDDDLQQLIIEEHVRLKASITLAVKNHMKATENYRPNRIAMWVTSRACM